MHGSLREVQAVLFQLVWVTHASYRAVEYFSGQSHIHHWAHIHYWARWTYHLSGVQVCRLTYTGVHTSKESSLRHVLEALPQVKLSYVCMVRMYALMYMHIHQCMGINVNICTDSWPWRVSSDPIHTSQYVCMHTYLHTWAWIQTFLLWHVLEAHPYIASSYVHACMHTYPMSSNFLHGFLPVTCPWSASIYNIELHICMYVRIYAYIHACTYMISTFTKISYCDMPLKLIHTSHLARALSWNRDGVGSQQFPTVAWWNRPWTVTWNISRYFRPTKRMCRHAHTQTYACTYVHADIVTDTQVHIHT
jgi:hypothetical protein